MAFGSVHAELDITGNRNLVVVLINLAFCVISDIAAALDNVPALEVVGVVLDGVAHVDLVALLGSR